MPETSGLTIQDLDSASKMQLDPALQNGLAWYWALVALLNAGFALYYLRAGKRNIWVAWAAVTGLYLLHAAAYALHLDWVMPLWLRQGIDFLMGPVVYTSLAFGLFVVMLIWRRFFVQPQVAWAILNISLIGVGWSLTDPNFRAIVTKPDNLPIPLLIYSVGFLTWLAMYKAVKNDERVARGEPVLEKLDDEKVLVWPDLVYTELICMIIATVGLIVWAVALKAPLEPPATSAKAPNPSKAPWYFLGLQEMLVYFDPWMAGVVLPSLIIVGLIALPYIDFNREGNGYYTFKTRWFAVTVFMFGFLVLWIILIVLGTFLRGPNWNFFGPFSFWDPHKVDPLNNVNVSDIFWLNMLGQPLKGMPILQREAPGLILILAYFLVLPPVLARTVFRKYFIKMGFVRFIILMILLLFMALLPIKMVLRWSFNLKYIVYIPEIFFNI
jgi:hypothetical protein